MSFHSISDSKAVNQEVVEALKERLVGHDAVVIMEENPVKLGSVAMILPRVLTLPLPLYLCATQEKLGKLKSTLEAKLFKPFYIFGGHPENDFAQEQLKEMAKKLGITDDSFFLSEHPIHGIFLCSLVG